MGAWLNQMFAAGQANKGGLVRRSVKNVRKYGGGEAALVREARRRGFHVVKTGRQYVVLCHPGKQTILC